MAAQKVNKDQKWKVSKERTALEQKLQMYQKRIDTLNEQKDLLYKSYEAAIEDGNEKLQAYAKSQIVDIKEMLRDTNAQYNDTVDAITKLDEDLKTRSDKIFRAVEVIGAVGLGLGGLALTHRDSIEGHLKDKNADGFFQTAWRKIFH